MNKYVKSAKLNKVPWDPVDTTKINFRESLTISFEDTDICGVPATDFMSILNAMIKEEIEKMDRIFVMTAIFFFISNFKKPLDKYSKICYTILVIKESSLWKWRFTHEKENSIWND